MRPRFIVLLAVLLSGITMCYSQVVDSLNVSASLVSTSFSRNFLNLGEDGLVLFGVQPAPWEKGLVKPSKVFEIRQYDTTFHVISKTIELSQKVIASSFVADKENVYVLLIPYVEASHIAFIIVYNIKSHDLKSISIKNQWKHPDDYHIQAAAGYVYITHANQVNGGYGVIIKEYRLEVVDCSQVTPGLVELTGSAEKDMELYEIQSVTPSNISDSIYFQFSYNDIAKDEAFKKEHHLLCGYYKDHSFIKVSSVEKTFYLQHPLVFEKNGTVCFYTSQISNDSLLLCCYKPVDGRLQKETILTSIEKEIPQDELNLFPWIKCDNANRFTAYQFISDEDYRYESFNGNFRVIKWQNNKTVADTSFQPFTSGDRSVTPKPYMTTMFVNQGSLYVICSSLQKLNCYKLDNTNTLSLQYSIQLPICQKSGFVPSATTNIWQSFAERGRLRESINVEQLYSHYFLAYNLTSSDRGDKVTLRAYKLSYY